MMTKTPWEVKASSTQNGARLALLQWYNLVLCVMSVNIDFSARE